MRRKSKIYSVAIGISILLSSAGFIGDASGKSLSLNTVMPGSYEIRLSHKAQQLITSTGILQRINFSGAGSLTDVDYDTASMFSEANHGVVIPVNGVYIVSASWINRFYKYTTYTAASYNPYMEVVIFRNGTDEILHATTFGFFYDPVGSALLQGFGCVCGSHAIQLAAGDVITMSVGLHVGVDINTNYSLGYLGYAPILTVSLAQ